jgi:hypothetical protein
MRKIIIFLLILLATILFTSCTTQQRVVYRDCDCNTTTFGFGWNTNPYWNNPFWGYQHQWWGFNNWYAYPYRVIPRYYIQPEPPTRYERRQSVGARPGRVSSDNVYPTRTPSIPRMEVRPSQQNSQPSRVQNNTPYRGETPSRVQQRTYTPSRVETPSRVQQRTSTPTGNQPTRSRVQNYQ